MYIRMDTFLTFGNRAHQQYHKTHKTYLKTNNFSTQSRLILLPKGVSPTNSHRACLNRKVRAPERPDQSLHVVVQSLQKQAWWRGASNLKDLQGRKSSSSASFGFSCIYLHTYLNGGLFFFRFVCSLISGSQLLCFSLLLCFSAFLLFPACLLLCVFLLFCFFASLLLCFSSFLVLCLSASPLFCFSHIFSAFPASPLLCFLLLNASLFTCFYYVSLLFCFSASLLVPVLFVSHTVDEP